MKKPGKGKPKKKAGKRHIVGKHGRRIDAKSIGQFIAETKRLEQEARETKNPIIKALIMKEVGIRKGLLLDWREDIKKG